MELIEINKRYSDLAESTCCLSCGGAVADGTIAAIAIARELG